MHSNYSGLSITAEHQRTITITDKSIFIKITITAILNKTEIDIITDKSSTIIA